MDCPFELAFASATCKTAHCRGGLGEAHVNLKRPGTERVCTLDLTCDQLISLQVNENFAQTKQQ